MVCVTHSIRGTGSDRLLQWAGAQSSGVAKGATSVRRFAIVRNTRDPGLGRSRFTVIPIRVANWARFLCKRDHGAVD
jgi:hypothetical protein